MIVYSKLISQLFCYLQTNKKIYEWPDV